MPQEIIKKKSRISGNFITKQFLWIYIIFHILIKPKNPRISFYKFQRHSLLTALHGKKLLYKYEPSCEHGQFYISLLLTSHRVRTRNKSTKMMSYGYISETMLNPATALLYPMAPRRGTWLTLKLIKSDLILNYTQGILANTVMYVVRLSERSDLILNLSIILLSFKLIWQLFIET